MAQGHLPLRTALGYRDSTASLVSGTSNGDLIGASDDEALDAYDRVSCAPDVWQYTSTADWL